MLSTSPLVAFVPTTDLDAAAAFYAGVLGLSLTERSPYACLFDCDGRTLRVTLVTDAVEAGHTVLGWTVDDIADKVDALVSAGVVFERYDGMAQDGRGVWTTPGGDRVAWFRDPAGNLLSLTEMPPR